MEMEEEWKKYDNRPLSEIAIDMLNWCISRGCADLGETPKEFRVTCPNGNCPAKEKSEAHKTFDVNKETAKFNCFHCGLSGQGLHGSGGLIAKLESGNFSFSASSTGKQNLDTEFFKPKEKVEIKPCIDRQQYSNLFRKYGLKSETARAYLKKRGVLSEIESDTEYYHICAVPKGTQVPFRNEPLNGEIIIFPSRKSINSSLEVIHLQYRYIAGGDWYNIEGPPKRIWWTKQHSEIVVLVEGIADALSIAAAGCTGCALLGTKITADYDLEPFRDKIVVLLLDNDKEGRNAVAKVASKLVNIASEVRIAIIPQEIDGKQANDPNDVLVKCGAEKLQEIIESAKLYDAETEQSESAESDKDDDTIMAGQQQAESSANADTQQKASTENKPKKETGIVFPEQAWRGIFETYRQAQIGTTEAPDCYHFGIFKTVAGVILGRGCYVWNGRNLYPNFFTVLIGPTRKSRKTTAKSRGETLLADTDPLVIVQRGLATPEGLIGRLQVPDEDDLNGLPEIEQQRAMSVSESEGYRMLVCINEFASLLKKAKKETGSGLIPTLTDAYDCQDSLDNPTLRCPLSARKPFLSMVALSTKVWLETNLDADDIHGGFVNRHLFYLWKQTEPLHNPPQPNGFLLNKIKNKLHEIRKAKAGKHEEFTFSNEADTILKEWYIKNYYVEYDSEIVDAAVQRVDENLRKLSLLYAVLENEPNDTEIKADQLQAAIAVGKYWETTAIEIFGKFGATPATRSEVKILEILSGKPLAKSEIHLKMSGVITAKQIDEMLKHLISVGRVAVITDKYVDTLGRHRKRQLYTLSEN